ncbi:MAG: hypothetical protein ONB46_02065 [candidate division KSB1 bacterium]|nr:hypothetical protein [candidate division KSB1 bacterium]MDZ7364454.1 hypothetical protein [candidate division KSB1 bacterium]MDZ7402826.1 hypothetical protein [candidate division KSB1 bacterium]
MSAGTKSLRGLLRKKPKNLRGCDDLPLARKTSHCLINAVKNVDHGFQTGDVKILPGGAVQKAIFLIILAEMRIAVEKVETGRKMSTVFGSGSVKWRA